MSDLARRLIDAIQNSLLGDLFLRLWPILPLYEITTAQGERRPIAGFLIAILCLLGLVAWALGFMAVHARPRSGGALERIQGAPSNGFEVWSKPPVGGLKPPRLTRAIVMALGKPIPREAKWLIWLADAVLIAAYGLFFLSYIDRAFLASVSPALAASHVRVGLSWSVLVLMAVAIPRSWAVNSRKKLEAGDAAPATFGQERRGS